MITVRFLMNGRTYLILLVLALCFLFAAHAQRPSHDNRDDPKLPSGKSQREEILKADHERSLKDVAELVKISEDLQIELEKNDRHVVSVSSLKKLDDIEKLAKRIKFCLKRY